MAQKVKEMAGRATIQWWMTLFVPLVIIGGHYYPLLGWTVAVMIAAFMVLTFFRGRYFCGWFCGLGAFFERILSKVSKNKPMLPLFNKSWFRWMVFGLMMTLLSSRLYWTGGNIDLIGSTFRSMWILSLGFAVAFGIFFKPRTWCTVCPMGTMQGILSPRTYLLTVNDNCKQCGLCSKACPIETEPGQHKETGSLPSMDCMRCGNCVETCPKSALSFESPKMNRLSILQITQPGEREADQNPEIKKAA